VGLLNTNGIIQVKRYKFTFGAFPATMDCARMRSAAFLSPARGKAVVRSFLVCSEVRV
jgi:hypothetical protein